MDQTVTLEQTRLVPCPRCGKPTLFQPAPGQKTNEDALGPYSHIHDFLDPKKARITEPAADGQTWLLMERAPGQAPTYWPAELNCERCRAEANRAAFLWNSFMGR